MTDDGTQQVNNPRRVPPSVEAAEPIQEGLPRTIHPIGAPAQRVGSELARTEQAMQPLNTFPGTDEEFITVEEDTTRLSENGKDSIEFRKGQRVHKSVAARFGLSDQADAGLARGADERPDIAHSGDGNDSGAKTPGHRSQGGAPQNASKGGAPEKAAKGSR